MMDRGSYVRINQRGVGQASLDRILNGYTQQLPDGVGCYKEGQCGFITEIVAMDGIKPYLANVRWADGSLDCTYIEWLEEITREQAYQGLQAQPAASADTREGGGE